MPGQQWHLEKSVSDSHLLTAVTILIGLVAAWFALEGRVIVLETQYMELSNRVVTLLENQAETDQRQDATQATFRVEMRQDAQTINAKLDRVLELAIRQAQ